MKLYHYSIGYGLSILLTICAFGLAQSHIASHHAFPSHEMLAASVASLAIIQLCVQLVFFLHLGRGTKRRDAMMLLVAVFTIALFVGGTLWIMSNLMHAGMVPFDGTVAPQTETNG